MLQVIAILTGVLAVLTLGALGGPASAETAAPCHAAMEALHGAAPADAPAPVQKPTAAMGCCVACVSAPALPARAPDAAPVPPADHAPFSRLLPDGRSPAPEPGPPRA